MAAIGKNDPDRKVIVDTALQWLLCAYRDLNIGELQIAASIKRDGTEYRSLKIRKLNLLSNFMVEGVISANARSSQTLFQLQVKEARRSLARAVAEVHPPATDCQMPGISERPAGKPTG